MEEARILGKGQLVIPVNIRRKFSLKPGDAVKVFDYDDTIHIIPLTKNPIKEAIGSLPKKPSLAKKLLKDRARE